MQVVHFEVRIHGRMEVVSGNPDLVLVGFHGYAETAAKHLAELRSLRPAAEWTLAAVQALHPFYTRAGDVVASWMTSLDRELAIDDNLRYVSAAVARLRSANSRVVFAGFSQGAAMAYRAASTIPCAGLIVLGGDMPPDVLPRVANLPRTLIGRGHADEWFTDEKLKKDLKVLSQSLLTLVEFEGGHEWTDAFREAASRFLDEIASAGG